jgi:acyl carrier protein
LPAAPPGPAGLRGRNAAAVPFTSAQAASPLDSARPHSQLQPPGACPLSPDTDLERGPLGRQEVLDLIRDRLADILEIDPDGIAEGASFSDDLDADSLALIELVEALEEELGTRNAGFRIDDEDLEDLKTVRDAVDYVVARTGGTSSP